MSTDLFSSTELASGPLHRIEASFEALNARIARLALILDVPLVHDQHVQAVLQKPQPGDCSTPQESRLWSELRGLLVLRYGMEKNYAEQLGATTLKQILIDAEEHLELEGFKPGADGMHMSQLFGKE
jgi:hypothetical protein